MEFSKQREDILNVIVNHGGALHQDDFDGEFKDCSVRNGKIQRRVFGFVPLWFTVGIWTEHPSYQRWLYLIKQMVSEGTINIIGESPNIIYSIPGS